MLLTVIIVSYNTKKLTLQTIDSVLKNTERSALLKKETEIIVVDNHSQDNSSAEIAKQFPQVILISNQDNIGFARANNQAIVMAKGKYLLLLNSDTIVQNGSIEKLVATMEKNPLDDTTAALAYEDKLTDRLGILAARLLNPDLTDQPQGGSLPNLLTLGCHMLMLDDLPFLGKWLPSTQDTGLSYQQKKMKPLRSNVLIKKEWVGGTAMMIRKELINEIGALDENIFMYGEDIEFCLRAKAHQWDIAELLSAPIIHLGSASSSSTNALKGELKNYIYIWSKHYPTWQLPIVKTLIKIGCYLRIWVFGTMKHDLTKTKTYQELAKTI